MAIEEGATLKFGVEKWIATCRSVDEKVMRSFSFVISVKRPFMEAVEECCMMERSEEVGSWEALCWAILR